MIQKKSNWKMTTLAEQNKRLSATLLPGDIQRLTKLSEKSGVSVSCIARQAIRKYLASLGCKSVTDAREDQSILGVSRT